MTRHSLALAAIAFALVACRPDAPQPPSFGAAFSTLPLPPGAQFVSRAGSSDALMLTFRSPLPADSVTGYYRRMFHADTSYKVLGDSKGEAGEQAFYVEVATRPLWIRIRPDAGTAGSVVELTGAVVAQGSATNPDSAGRPAAK